MRRFRHSDGTWWEGVVIGGFGVGARADSLPAVTHQSAVFTGEDGRQVNRTLMVGELERATDAELSAILERPDSEDDE